MSVCVSMFGFSFCCSVCFSCLSLVDLIGFLYRLVALCVTVFCGVCPFLRFRFLFCLSGFAFFNAFALVLRRYNFLDPGLPICMLVTSVG